MAEIILTEGTSPPTPPAGSVSVFVKTDKDIYIKDSTGAETNLTDLGGGGGNQLVFFEPNVAIYPSSISAGANTRNDHMTIDFDAATIEAVLFRGVMSKDYSGGSFTVDLDWVAATKTTGDVVWGIEFERLNAGGSDIDSNSFSSQKKGSSTTDPVNGKISRTSITLTQAEADGIVAGEGFRIRVKRAATDPDDTMNNDDARLLLVNLRQ